MGRIARAVESNQEAIRALLERSDVTLAYVFGSASRGLEREDSDLDLAILFGDRVPAAARSKLRLDLLTELVGLTHVNDIDLIILNDAPPLLAYKVASAGRSILGERQDRFRFEVEAIKRYIDTQPLRDRIASRLDRRIREGAREAGTASEPW
jgi:uncharacterized protein